jgi:hypothetical protein
MKEPDPKTMRLIFSVLILFVPITFVACFFGNLLPFPRIIATFVCLIGMVASSWAIHSFVKNIWLAITLQLLVIVAGVAVIHKIFK